MKPIAIIPARGGSKRLPRKNIMPLDGVPLVARVIANTIDANIFSSIIVSTEDDEIASICRQYGAEVVERSIENAQDRSTVVDVCIETLAKIDEVDSFCCIYPTAALLSHETMKTSWNNFNSDKNTDILLGVSNFNYAPVQALTIDDKGFAKLAWPEMGKKQSQFYPEMKVSNGTFIWVKREKFETEKSFYGENLKTFLVPENEVSDVNTLEDFLLLQEKYEKNQ